MALKLREMTVIPQLAVDCTKSASFACLLCKDSTFKVLIGLKQLGDGWECLGGCSPPKHSQSSLELRNYYY